VPSDDQTVDAARAATVRAVNAVQTKPSTDVRSRLAAASRRAAWISFAVMIVLSPFRASVDFVRDLGGSASPTPAWALIAALATVGFWVVSLAASPRRIGVGPWFVALPVAGLLAVSWLGIAVSVEPAVTAKEALVLALVTALGVYILNELDGIERLVVPLMAMIVVQAVVAIGQVLAQQSLGLTILGEQTLLPSDGGISVVTAADGTRSLRAYGLTDHPNILGGILTFALIILGSVRGLEGRRSTARWVVFALAIVALFLTYSRAAWIAYGVGVALALALLGLMRDRAAVRRWLLATGGALLVCAPLVVAFTPSIAARVNAAGSIGAETRSIDERLALAQGAIAIFLERPVLGIGLGTLPGAMVVPQAGFDPHQAAHIVLLDVAAETGVIGAACYLVLIVAPWVALVRARRRWTPELVAASAALAAVTTVGFLDHYTWTTPAGLIWVSITVGIWAAAYRTAGAEGSGA
jgi:O-antigen ligase